MLKTPIAFIATVNADESRYFYETVLGLNCLSDDPYALVFDLGVTTLRVQKVDSIPDVNHTVLGWEVVNIRECADVLTKKGVKFQKFSQLKQDDLGVWCSPSGASIAWFKDPDGNTLSLTEP